MGLYGASVWSRHTKGSNWTFVVVVVVVVVRPKGTSVYKERANLSVIGDKRTVRQLYQMKTILFK